METSIVRPRHAERVPRQPAYADASICKALRQASGRAKGPANVRFYCLITNGRDMAATQTKSKNFAADAVRWQ